MQRPAAVTVFGVLNLVLGGLGVLCTPIILILFLWQKAYGNPFLRTADVNGFYGMTGVYGVYLIVAALLGILSACAQIAAGIGLLQMKPWARLLSIGYAAVSIVMGVIGLALNAVFVMGPSIAMARGGGPQAAARIGGVAGGLIGGVLSLIYPVVLLIFMMQSRIRGAFAYSREAPPVI